VDFCQNWDLFGCLNDGNSAGSEFNLLVAEFFRVFV
jgi:hypothetical protein